MDKENTPPPERRTLRSFTPPSDYEKSLTMIDDVSFYVHNK